MRKLLTILILLTLSSVLFAADPPWLTALPNSTANWSPYPLPPMPAPGASYTDDHHTSNGVPLPVTRIPAIPSTCDIPNWSGGGGMTGPNSGLLYGGQYYMIPYSAGVGSRPNYAIKVTRSNVAGDTVLHFDIPSVNLGSPAVSVVGAAGSTTYAYTVVANYAVPSGYGSTIAPAATTINNGNATLTTSNKNVISWVAPANQVNLLNYSVYRTTGGTTQGRILVTKDATVLSVGDVDSVTPLPATPSDLFTSVTYTHPDTHALDAGAGMVLPAGFDIRSTSNVPANDVVASWDDTTITLTTPITGPLTANTSVITIVNPPPYFPWSPSTQADICAARSMVPSYSERQAFNADQTEFYVIASNSVTAAYFYKWNNGNPVYDFTLANSAMSTTNGDESWSHTDPNKMYYANYGGGATGSPCPGNIPCLQNLTLTPGTPSTAAISTEHTWTIGAGQECPTGTLFVGSGGDSSMSEDDRYRAVFCGIGTNNTPSRILVYDYQAHAVVSSRDVSAMCGTTPGIDVLAMSPDGNDVILSWKTNLYEDSWTTCHGVELFDRATLTTKGMIGSVNEGHLAVGRDVNGFPAVTMPNGHKFTYESTDLGWSFNSVRLSEVHAPNQGGTWDSYGEVDIPVSANSSNTILTFASDVDFSKVRVGAFVSDMTTAGSKVGVAASSVGIPASTTVNKICKTVGTGCTTANTLVISHAATGVTAGDVIAIRESRNASYVRRLYLPCSLYSKGVVLTTSAATASGTTLAFTDTTGITSALVTVGLTVSGINIPDGTTVVSYIANTSVTLSNPVTGTGVDTGAVISFIGDPYTGCGVGSSYQGITHHMSGRGAGAGPSQGWFLLSVFPQTTYSAQSPGWGRNEALALRVDTTEPVVNNATYRRISNMFGFRQAGASNLQCTGGFDYFQEPHATASQDFSKVIFASSWMSECGQIGVFAVNLNASGAGVPPAITTTSLASGTSGSVYSQVLTATGDTPITWRIVAGALPTGLTLNASTGSITGTPVVTGTAPFTVRATNPTGEYDKSLSIAISSPSTTLVGVTIGGGTRVQ